MKANGSDQIAALSDGTRRRIFEFLGKQATAVGDLAEKLPVTRSAVSQHLRALQDVGLVKHRKSGTRHIYYIDPEGVANLRAYLDRMWDRALREFKTAAEEPGYERRKR